MKETLKGPDPEYIKNLFNSISSKYDRTNQVMTLGMLNHWRKKLIALSEVRPGNSVLDCATGTGDFALAFKKAVGPSGHVVGSDFCEGMLKEAPIKAKKKKLEVHFEWADVTDLPYDNHHFDVVSIGYGIRNVNDPFKALKEMARVCKPGGRVMILETGDSYNPLLKPFLQIYFKSVVPTVGQISGGNKSAYEYLNQSSSSFPCGDRFVALMRSTHAFNECESFRLLGGASYIYRGRVK